MTGEAKRAKEANSKFYRLIDKTDSHVRIPNERGMGVTLIGHAADLHGPDGKCSCCYGRTAPTSPVDEWAVFVEALDAARCHRADCLVGGVHLHQDDVRPLIRGRIYHKHIGQFYARAKADLLLIPLGEEQSRDTEGRNTHHKSPVYELRSAA